MKLSPPEKDIQQPAIDGNFSDRTSGATAGKSLRRILHQDDSLSKIERQQASVSLLMNGNRMEIFLYLFRNPADHTRSIARGTGLSLNGVQWHLNTLIRCEYIESTAIRGKRAYWPQGMVKPADANLVFTLRHGRSMEIIRNLRRKEAPMRQNEIVKELGEAQQNVSVWLARMVAAQILMTGGNGSNAGYWIDPVLSVKLRQYDALSGEMSERLVGILANDGLMPVKSRMRGSRLSVRVTLPSGARNLTVDCNPLAMLRRAVF